MAMTDHGAEIREGRRFEFGANWARFLESLDEARIERAQRSLQDMLGAPDLRGKRFLDVGSGSGLFSLAARRLGASVRSFDYDPKSVACTQELRRRYFPDDPDWTVERGSALDADYLGRLGRFDVVYSWGVLHHTGALWQALENVSPLVADGGRLFLAIYNDQGWASVLWLRVKQLYNRLPGPLRWLVLGPAFVRLWGPAFVRDLLHGDPARTWREGVGRGMDPWRDVVDWVGGLPFEAARPEKIVDYYAAKGFRLERLETSGGGHGCNEFVFSRPR